MDLSKLMGTTPEDLAQLQYDELKNFTIQTLENVLGHIKQENFEIIKREYLFYSPAGDGYGDDNYCIDFSYNPKHNVKMDISDIITMLIRLKSLTNDTNGTKK